MWWSSFAALRLHRASASYWHSAIASSFSHLSPSALPSCACFSEIYFLWRFCCFTFPFLSLLFAPVSSMSVSPFSNLGIFQIAAPLSLSAHASVYMSLPKSIWVRDYSISLFPVSLCLSHQYPVTHLIGVGYHLELHVL